MSKRIHDLPEDIAEVVRAMVPCLAPPMDDLDVAGIEDMVIDQTGRMIAGMIPFSRWGIFLAFRFFEWFPVLSGFGFSRFTRLSEKQRVQYVEKWAMSSWAIKRELFKIMRGILMMTYFSDRRVWDYIGYNPEPHMEERIKMHDELVKREEAGSKKQEA